MKKALMCALLLTLLSACGNAKSNQSEIASLETLENNGGESNEAIPSAEAVLGNGRFSSVEEVVAAVKELKDELMPLDEQFGEVTMDGFNIYHGELTNSVPNGVGMMYYLRDDEDTIGKAYYGTFEYGKASGKGIIRYPTSSTQDVYVGEVKDGRPSGKGIYYNIPTKETVVGQFVDQPLDFNESVYEVDGRSYVGEMSDGLPQGKGRMNLFEYAGYDRNFFIFEGEFNKGKIVQAAEKAGEQTYGLYTLESGALYIGELLNGLPNGWGTYTYNDQVISTPFVEGKTIGKGIIDDQQQNIYIGNIEGSYPNGIGIQFSGPNNNRALYIGDFKQGVPEGKGLIRQGILRKYGDLSVGEISNNQLNGIGEMTTSGDENFKGDLYQGELIDGVPSGFGFSRKGDGSSFTGQWELGQPEGKGTLTTADEQKQTGQFSNGQFIGE